MLSLKNVKWTAEDGSEILKGVNLVIETGKLTVITGPNGGGKTTLAKVISGVNELTEGEIWLDDINITDKDITERAQLGVAYAFQQPVRFKGITVRDLIELSSGRKTIAEADIEARLGTEPAPDEMSDEELTELMHKVGICKHDYIDREVNSSLSGGEIKRIEIASVLARKGARMYIFDEPEAGIDLWSFAGLVAAFEELKAEGDKTIVVISHQERLLEIADNIVVIADGVVSRQGAIGEILPELLAEEAGGVRRGMEV